MHLFVPLVLSSSIFFAESENRCNKIDSNPAAMQDIAEEFFLAEINPSNSDHTYSLVVQTEPEVEIETIGDDVTTEQSGYQVCEQSLGKIHQDQNSSLSIFQ